MLNLEKEIFNLKKENSILVEKTNQNCLKENLELINNASNDKFNEKELNNCLSKIQKLEENLKESIKINQHLRKINEKKSKEIAELSKKN